MKTTGTGLLLGRQSHGWPSGLLAWRPPGVVGILLVAVVASWGAAPQVTAAGDPCSSPKAAYDRGGSPGRGVVNDPLFERQWGLQRVKAPDVWKKGATGKGAVIAILDTGVDLSHPDLRNRLVRGVDLTDEPGCPGPQDESGHGTMVAGVAAASANNGIGIAGVAPKARLMPVRVFTGSEGSSPDDIRDVNRTFAKGIKWAVDHGADVINISYTLMLVTDYPIEDDGLEKALSFAWGKGAVVIAAAGNNLSLPICDYPANDVNVVCVGATDELGLPAAYSNQPVNSNGGIGLRAPGGRLALNCNDPVDIWTTTLPGYCGDLSGYMTTQGTSFASPHVAGVAALLAGKGLANEEIVECLSATALNPLTGMRGQFDPIYGYGEVDAAAAVQECA